MIVERSILNNNHSMLKHLDFIDILTDAYTRLFYIIVLTD